MVVRRSDARANREKVLRAAREVFAEEGQATEIKEIAERAGVGVATIYRGFGSKEELLQATIEAADDAISALLSEAEAIDDPVEALRLLISRLLEFAESYGWLIQASLAGNDGRARPALKRRDEHRRRVLRLIEAAVKSGGIPSNLPVPVIKLLIDGAVFALAIRSRRKEPHPSAAATADGLFRVLTGEAAR